jgi:DNA excision repair protein ERCC-2
VRGRADGYDPDHNQLEEVKTFRGDLHAMAGNRRHLHWAQLKIYGWLLCDAKKLQDINLTLVYFDVASTQETPLTEHFSAASLKEYFETQCERFLAWANQELAHRQARDAGLARWHFRTPRSGRVNANWPKRFTRQPRPAPA